MCVARPAGVVINVYQKRITDGDTERSSHYQKPRLQRVDSSEYSTPHVTGRSPVHRIDLRCRPD